MFHHALETSLRKGRGQEVSIQFLQDSFLRQRKEINRIREEEQQVRTQLDAYRALGTPASIQERVQEQQARLVELLQQKREWSARFAAAERTAASTNAELQQLRGDRELLRKYRALGSPESLAEMKREYEPLQGEMETLTERVLIAEAIAEEAQTLLSVAVQRTEQAEYKEQLMLKLRPSGRWIPPAVAPRVRSVTRQLQGIDRLLRAVLEEE